MSTASPRARGLGALAPTLLLALAPAAPLATPLAAQGSGASRADDRGAYVVRLGTDTLAVESFVRTRDRIEVDAAVRSPTTTVRHYVINLKPNGAPARMEYDARRLDGSSPPTRATVTVGVDTTVVALSIGDSARTLRVAARDAVPFVNLTYPMMELATMRAVAAKADSVDVVIVGLGAPQSNVLPIRKLGRDSLTIWFFGDPMHARIDRAGHLLGLEGRSTTQKVTVERVARADVQAFAAASALRDQQGTGMGQLSPRDSIEATAGAARVSVNYGRPSKRGRTILGDVIPYDRVWRTGANAATAFTTSADLVINGTPVPAGSYTLWTLPTRAGWKLIVNKQTGQWGTEYKQEQDLARIDLISRKLPTPAEQFTIAVEPSGEGGAIRMQWDDVELTAPFTVVKR
jgi:hypothetical protein